MSSTYRAQLFIAATAIFSAQGVTPADGESNYANAGYAKDFQEFCQGDLDNKRMSTFESALSRAEQALKAGQLDDANTALREAQSTVMRGSADNQYGISVKCLGEATTRRVFNIELDYQRQLAGEKRRFHGGPPAWVIAFDKGTDGLINAAQGKSPVQFKGFMNAIETTINNLEVEKNYGAFLLNEEQQIIAACKAALPELTKQATKEFEAALAAEAKFFTLAPSDRDKDITDNAAVLEAAMGVSFDTEAKLIGTNISQSREHLTAARNWNPQSYDTIQERPSSQRARVRGDAVLVKADNTDISYRARDGYYEAAIKYYEFGGWDSQANRARQSRQTIQEDVRTEQARNDAALADKSKELEANAEEMRRAAESMQKTEAEKQSFKDEADALEAELGF